jgi:hypothetical protein
LKPAFAGLYPGIPANEWLPVAVMLELVRSAQQRLGVRLSPAEHVLNAEHFIFRATLSAGSKDAEREGRAEARRPRRPK